MDRMQNFDVARSGVAIVGLLLASGPASALTFQGVTFTTTYLSPTSFSLTIEDALTGGTGNWANVDYLRSLSIKGFGEFSTATVDPTATFSGRELNNSFCAGGDSGGACFTWASALPVSDDMVFLFTFTGSNITAAMTPHVKLGFLCGITSTDACGSLLSQDVPFGNTPRPPDVVPEPGTLALLGLGFLGLGVYRRRTS